MKYQIPILMTITLLAAPFWAADARVSVHLELGTHPRHEYRTHSPRYVHYWGPRYGHPYYRRTYISTPIIVQQPTYIAPVPVYAVPSTPSPVSGDYGKDWAEFNDGLNRLYAVVRNQYEKGQMTETEHDRFTGTLETIQRDARARAFERGGTLHSGDFADLFRRTDAIRQDIEIALAD